jgi:DNA-binding transcriptional LysR family regulator
MGSPPTGIELRHLRYFLAVIEELHFGHAAERLHIAQSPLSQAIRKIEDGLGVQLLVRTSRTVAPTEAGEHFAEQARTVLAKFDRAVEAARRAGGVGSALRVACNFQFPVDLMQRLLEAWLGRAPGLQVDVVHLRALEQVSRLRADELDLAIVHHAQDHDEIETETLFAGEPLAAFLPLGHPLAEKDVLRAGDLSQETLVTFPRVLNPALYAWILRQLQDGGYRFAELWEASGVDSRDLVLPVANGRGILVAPIGVAEGARARHLVERRPLDPPLAMPDTVVAWRASPSAHVLEALDALRDAARSLGRRALAEAVGDHDADRLEQP